MIQSAIQSCKVLESCNNCKVKKGEGSKEKPVKIYRTEETGKISFIAELEKCIC